MVSAVVSSNVSNRNQEIERRGTKRSYCEQLISSDHSDLATPKQEPEDDFVELIESETYSGSTSEEFSPPVKRGRGIPPMTKKQVMESVRSVQRRIIREKTVFTYPMILTMALMNSPNGRATVPMLYDSVIYIFPCLAISSHWRNTLRHALSANNGFKKEDPYSRSSFWSILPNRKDGLIKSIMEIIVEYRERPEYLMMRNTDDLSSILAGTYKFPSEVRMSYVSPIQNEPLPATAREIMRAIRKNAVKYNPIGKAKQLDTAEVERQSTAKASPVGWIPYSASAMSDTIYSNQFEPTHHPIRVYGNPHLGYGIPMYANQKEEYKLINDIKQEV